MEEDICSEAIMCVCDLCVFSDLLAVPKHPYAAMENWGLSVFVEQKILLDADVSSSSYQMELTMVVVHEICHQVGTFAHLRLEYRVWSNPRFGL